MLKEASTRLSKEHKAIEIPLYSWPKKSVIQSIVKSYETIISSQNLPLTVTKGKYNRIWIGPKPSEKSILENGAVQRSYPNGITEVFSKKTTPDWLDGRRTFSDGSREIGTFNAYSFHFRYGYKIDPQGNIDFSYCPRNTPIVSILSEAATNYEKIWHIHEIEDQLIVSEQKFIYDEKTNRHTERHKQINYPLEDVLMRSFKINEGRELKNLDRILSHKSFAESKGSFIEKMVATTESGTPRLFTLPIKAALEILEAIPKDTEFAITDVVDPKSKRNFLLEIAHRGDLPSLERLMKRFPKATQSLGNRIIESFLLAGQNDFSKSVKMSLNSEPSKLGKMLQSQGVSLDDYHQLWLQIAAGTLPTAESEKKLSSLADKQKEILQKAADTYSGNYGWYTLLNSPLT